ncbi:MAG: twin-arginine translocase subunit TatC [candidate division Zixibacteria bacterium]|nr:twin-arginine translocase subunit TatC [candidate division Zixibacteria bacterium]
MTTPVDQPEEPKEESSGMPFLDHLEELRRRLIWAFLAVVIMSAVAFYFSDYLLEFIQMPLKGVPLHNMQVTGAFYAYLKISLFVGVVAALPVVFYHMWRFIAPGLYERERMMVIPLVLISTILFLIGASFCFVIVLPLALQFLIGFAEGLITNYITIDSYLSFAGLLMLAFGFGFQMPIVAYFLGRAGIISAGFLAKGRRYAVVLILVAAAIITPPDVFTQVLLGIPLYVLYEVSIIVVRVVQRQK